MGDPLQDVMEERIRQDEKWGVQDHDDLYWLGVLVEEVGELSKSIIEGERSDTKTELTQVAAVALAWRECLDRRQG